MDYVTRIAEQLGQDDPMPGSNELAKLKGGRLLLGPRGVQLTQRDGTTVQIEADSIVVQMPDGKLVKFEALMSQHGPFDRR